MKFLKDIIASVLTAILFFVSLPGLFIIFLEEKFSLPRNLVDFLICPFELVVFSLFSFVCVIDPEMRELQKELEKTGK